MKILFLHGWHSVPGGVKPSYLDGHGHEVINPALDDDDFDEAVRTAQAEYDRHHPDVIVGSSRGGAVAMNIGPGSTPLVLLCPAWRRRGKVNAVEPGTVIRHAQAYDLIPIAHGRCLIRNNGLAASALVVAWSYRRRQRSAARRPRTAGVHVASGQLTFIGPMKAKESDDVI